MGLLRSIARTGARATGRALSRHVVPDSLIPSWKTQQIALSGYNLLRRAAPKNGKPKGAKRATAPTRGGGPTAGTATPRPKPPKQKFDKNGWSMGRGLPTGFAVSSAASQRSYSQESEPSKSPGLSRKVKDAVRNPRLAVQMGLDLLQVEYQLKKRSFLSNFKRPV